MNIKWYDMFPILICVTEGYC